MKIFIDTAKLNEIKEAYSLGILDGVTTNPSLLKKAVDELKKQGKNVNITSYIKSILKAAKGTPVSLEVMGTTYKDMVSEGKKLYALFNETANNVCIKIPVNSCIDAENNSNIFDAIKAVKELSSNNIPVNCTLIFTPEQALMAAKAGAKYVSPFAGRIDDLIRQKHSIAFDKKDYYPMDGMVNNGILLMDNGIVSGVGLVRQCMEILKKYNYKTEVIAASIRNPRQARELASLGVDISTLPFDVIKGLLLHHKTEEGVKCFIADKVPEYNELFE